MAKHIEKKLEGETVFTGHIFTVTKDKVALENGNTSYREVVHHNGGAAIVAVNDKDEVALVQQFRYALGKELIELPAGKIEPNEPPMETAIRELQEEAGLVADHFVSFGSLIPTCGYCSEIIHLYYASGLHIVKQNLDQDEFLDVFWMPFKLAVQKAINGEITDSKTSLGLIRAYLLRNKKLGTSLD